MEPGYSITARIERENEDYDRFGVAVVCAFSEHSGRSVVIGRLMAAVYTPDDGYVPRIDGSRIVREFDALSQDSYELALSLSKSSRSMEDEIHGGIVGIVSIEVDPDHRGHGIGRAMVRALGGLEELSGHMVALQARPIGSTDPDMARRLRSYHMASGDVAFRSPSPRRDPSLLVGSWSRAA
jgi:ribosomal protein S18 acetylase RimI-like enzyme